MKKLLIVPALLLAGAIIAYSAFKPNQVINNQVYGSGESIGKPNEIVNSADNESDKDAKDALILVNKNHQLSSKFKPENLTIPNVNFAASAADEEKMMQGEAAIALANLFQYAHRQNIDLYGVSGYRSYEAQKQVYEERVRKVGKKQADKYVAQPGESEHQTGLAMDVTNKAGAQGKLLEDFGQTKEGKWLKDNAYKYGFIMRYQKEKEAITGYSYESWHIRYVGVNAAKDMFNKDMVLEEFLDEK